MNSDFEDYHGHLALETTNICNLRCRICYLWKEEPKFLGPDDIERIVVSLNKRFTKLGKKYCPLVTLTGGEPFLHPDIDEIYARIRKLRKRDMLGDVYTISNGFLTDRILRFLSGNEDCLDGLRMDFSIDGLEKNHNLLRGNNKAFENAVQTVLSVKKKYPNVPVSVKMVINKHNYRDIFELYLFAKKNNLGIRFLILEFPWNGFYNRDIKSGKRKEMMLNVKQKRETVKTVLKICRDVKKSRMERMIIGGNSHIFSLLKNLSGENARRCTSPKKEIFINSHGDLFPCIFRKPLTSIFKEGFENEIYSKRHKEMIIQSLKRECPMREYHCNFQKVTKCSF